MTFKIKAPNKAYEGIQVGIHFIHGEAETEDPKVAQIFKNLGYEVEGEKPKPKPKPQTSKPTEEKPKTTRKSVK